MALLPELDRNDESLVVTQALGHWLCVLSFSRRNSCAVHLTLPLDTTV
jgi:hypothetical protein